MATGSILIVDDEAKILNALAQALRAEGHEVVATTCAREAQRLPRNGCSIS
jgi:DNA-binding NtrC family response regulator